MAQEPITPVGLFTNPNALGGVPSGALSQADNVVISRDGVVEPRRGFELISAGSYIKRLIPRDTNLNRLLYYNRYGEYGHVSNGGALSPIASFISHTFLHTAEVAGNLYLTAADGVKRHSGNDPAATVPVASGVPQAILESASAGTAGAGAAIRADSQVAYRAVWLETDDAGNLHIGAPSGRVSYVNVAVNVDVGRVVVSNGVATATVAGHPFQTGDILTITDENIETELPAGDYDVTATSPTTFSFFVSAGLNFTSALSHRFGFASRDGEVRVVIPKGLRSGKNYFQLYRSPCSVNAETPASDEMGLVWESEPVQLFEDDVSLSRSTTETVTATFPRPHGFSVGDLVRVESNHARFPAGMYVVAAVPSADTLQYADASAGSEASTINKSVNVVAMVITDTVPDSLAGAALYTNPNQEGISQAAYEPPVAGDVAFYKSCMFYANTVSRHRVTFQLSVADGSDFTLTPYGVAPIVFTSSTTSVANSDLPRYQWFSDSSPAENIRRTAESLVAAINRTSANTSVRAFYVSGPDDVPGKIAIESLAASTNATVGSFTVHMADALPVTSSSKQDVWRNGLFYSKPGQPEAVPLFNFQRVGEVDKAILRIVPLQNALIVIKEEGIWRLIGDTPANFRIEPLDLTLRVIAPESCVAMNNRVYALSELGVVEITEGGARSISGPVDDLFLPLLTEAGRSALFDYAFGIGAAQDHKYILFIPSTATDTLAKQALVFDFFTQAWTRWTVPAYGGAVNNREHRIYLAGLGGILQERKTLTYSDYADYLAVNTCTVDGVAGNVVSYTGSVSVQAGDVLFQPSSNLWGVVTTKGTGTVSLDRSVAFTVGQAVKVWSGIDAAWKLAPRVGGNPGALNHFREVAFLFRQAHFSNASAAFSTDISPSAEEVGIVGARHTLPAIGATATPAKIRVGVPRNMQRSAEISVTFKHRQAYAPFLYEGASLVFNGSGEKVGKR